MYVCMDGLEEMGGWASGLVRLVRGWDGWMDGWMGSSQNIVLMGMLRKHSFSIPAR